MALCRRVTVRLPPQECEGGLTALSIVAGGSTDDVEILKLLVEGSPSPTTADLAATVNGVSALPYVGNSDALDVVLILLEPLRERVSSDVGVAGMVAALEVQLRLAPVHIACLRGNKRCFEYLLL